MAERKMLDRSDDEQESGKIVTRRTSSRREEGDGSSEGTGRKMVVGGRVREFTITLSKVVVPNRRQT